MHLKYLMAGQVNDQECVKTLISLGADFNKPDSMGRTPLDFARMIATGVLGKNASAVQMKQFEVGQKMVVGGEMIEEKGLTTTVELSASSFHDQLEWQSVPLEQPKATDRDMIDLLISVGAMTGSDKSREDRFISPLVTRYQADSASSLSTDPSEGATSASAENSFGSENYCKSYKLLDSGISKRLMDTSHVLTPEESLKLIEDMRKREQFRREYGSRILCLDGGGIRGLITISILQEIERKTNKNITDLFDWIVGTSTGGIIALGLCYGELIVVIMEAS